MENWATQASREERRAWNERAEKASKQVRVDQPGLDEGDLYWEGAARCLEEDGGVLEERAGFRDTQGANRWEYWDQEESAIPDGGYATWVWNDLWRDWVAREEWELCGREEPGEDEAWEGSEDDEQEQQGGE